MSKRPSKRTKDWLDVFMRAAKKASARVPRRKKKRS